MSMIGNRIKMLREENGWRQEELSSVFLNDYGVNIHRVTISNWESGKQTPEMINLIYLSKIFGVSIDYIVGNTDDRSSDIFRKNELLVPVVAEIAAGFDKEPIKDYEMDRFPVPSVYAKGRKIEDLFIIKVRGDSMFPMYQDGDHILAVRTPAVDDGDVAILQYEDNATIKRVERKIDGLRLIPINPMYKPETVKEGDQVRIVGKPLVLIRELEKNEE